MTHPLLGRNHVPEAPSALARLHFHKPGMKLATVDHEPKVAVLDQSDLISQGIHTSQFIPGCTTDASELGSCTCNTLTENFSNLLTADRFGQFVATLGSQPAPASPYTDTVAAERAAVGAYHQITDQTADPSSEWPPTDCGSSGPYLYQWALKNGWIGGEQIASDAQSIVSLMQTGACLLGLPWMSAWFEADSAGFIDGDGSVSAFQSAVAGGVAGGHEITLSAVEKVTLDAHGRVIPEQTVLRFRNHWTSSWALNGSGLIHLSTLVYLGSAIDVRQFQAAS